MLFLEEVANWADAASVDVSFFRDEYDGWMAKISLSDSKGPFSAYVTPIERGTIKDPETNKAKAEPMEQYQDRVARVCSKAIAKAREDRIKHIAKRMAYARA